MEKLAVIGLGLIGGSMALDLKKRFNYKVLGIDNNSEHIQKALELGIIDKAATFEDLTDVDVVIVAVPVDKIAEVSSQVLDVISNNTLVFDVGSVKKNICDFIDSHPKRKNFVAAHPLAGTEFSGPKRLYPTCLIRK